MADVARRAEQEIAVVLERVDVLRPAALDRAAAWGGTNSRSCRVAGTRSGTAPRSRPRRSGRSRPARRCARRSRAARAPRPGAARTSAARKKAKMTASGPRKIAAMVRGLVIASVARLPGSTIASSAAKGDADLVAVAQLAARRGRARATSSARGRRRRAARHASCWPSNAVADDFGLEGGDRARRGGSQRLGPDEQRRRRAGRQPGAGAALQRAERRFERREPVARARGPCRRAPLFSPTNEATNGVAGWS